MDEISFEITFDTNKLEQELMNDFGPGSEAQRCWSEIVFYGSEKYMPMSNEGNLISNSIAASVPVMAQGELIYPGPYAHYLWEGVVYVDPDLNAAGFLVKKDGVEVGWRSRKGVTKKRTDRELEFTDKYNKNAGARWVDRAAADNLTVWEADYQRMADAGFPGR